MSWSGTTREKYRCLTRGFESDCPGSGHMRRRGFFGCVSGKVLGGGVSAKGLVRFEGVEFIGEGVDPSVDVVEVVVGQVP